MKLRDEVGDVDDATDVDDVGHAGEVDDVDDDDEDEDDHADEDEDGEDDDDNDGGSGSDNDVDDCTTADDDDADDDDDGLDVDDVKKVMLRLILAGIVVENPFAKCFREKTIWFPNVENLECSILYILMCVCFRLGKLDNGWPESVEEQGLLLLVWRHYIKDVL